MREKGFTLSLVLVIVMVGVVVAGLVAYSRLKPNPQPQPTPSPSQATPSAEIDDKFDQSFVLKSISFTDSKNRARKFIVYSKFRDDARKEYADTYLTDENLTKSSAVKISRLSDFDGEHPNSGFGGSLLDNTATIDLSPGPGKKFIAVHYRVGDGESFLLIDEDGLVNENTLKNACDIVKNNYNLIDYSCFIKFKGWKDASKFYVELITLKSYLTTGGFGFRILIDATTGKTTGAAEKI